MTDDDARGLPEPGWYPVDSGLVRWWDGARWTGNPRQGEPVVPSRPDIEAAKALMKRSTFGAGRELGALAGYLTEGEVVQRIAIGTYAKATGLLALTSQRLLFLKTGIVARSFEDYPIGTVTSVSWSGGLVMGTLRFTVSGARAEITQVANMDGHGMADAIRGAIGGQRAMVAAKNAAPAAALGADVPAQLMQLKALLDAGVLEQQEYDAKKAELLARM